MMTSGILIFSPDSNFYYNEDNFYHLPPFDEVWLSKAEHSACYLEHKEHHHHVQDYEDIKKIDKTPGV